MTTYHTLVLHYSPDLDAGFMAYLIREYAEVRARLDVVERPELKFIPAGRLRAEDWPGVTPLTTAACAEQGYLFLDCGGGELDQHGRPENAAASVITSIDLLRQRVNLDELVPHLIPLIEAVSGNDRSGTDVAAGRNAWSAETPHTPRHLRNLVLGWNLQYADDPLTTFEHLELAFSGLDRLMREGETEAALLMLADTVCEGVRCFFEGFCGEAEGQRLTELFKADVNKALQQVEQAWNQAVEDYLDSTELVEVQVQKRVEGVAVGTTLTVANGRSNSSRYAAVTRYGNLPGRNGRPYTQIEVRPKADVTIQFYPQEGMFSVASRGIPLHQVALRLRLLDLAGRGVAITPAIGAAAGQPGQLVCRDRVGQEVETLYFPAFGTVIGNVYRTNPFAPPVNLTRKQIVAAVLSGLRVTVL